MTGKKRERVRQRTGLEGEKSYGSLGRRHQSMRAMSAGYSIQKIDQQNKVPKRSCSGSCSCSRSCLLVIRAVPISIMIQRKITRFLPKARRSSSSTYFLASSFLSASLSSSPTSSHPEFRLLRRSFMENSRGLASRGLAKRLLVAAMPPMLPVMLSFLPCPASPLLMLAPSPVLTCLPA